MIMMIVVVVAVNRTRMFHRLFVVVVVVKLKTARVEWLNLLACKSLGSLAQRLTRETFPSDSSSTIELKMMRFSLA